jgi:TonB family protein
VPFDDAGHPAIPVTGALGRTKNLTVPRATNDVEAEFSDEARRKQFSGVVMVTLVVTEEGMPDDAWVAVPAGMGLDEQAMKSVSQYRFEPANLDGIPVPVPTMVEVNFRLYDRHKRPRN